jgi:hypothetical protein
MAPTRGTIFIVHRGTETRSSGICAPHRRQDDEPPDRPPEVAGHLHVLAAVVVTQRLEGFVAPDSSIAPENQEVADETFHRPPAGCMNTAVTAELNVTVAARRVTVVVMSVA